MYCWTKKGERGIKNQIRGKPVKVLPKNTLLININLKSRNIFLKLLSRDKKRTVRLKNERHLYKEFRISPPLPHLISKCGPIGFFLWTLEYIYIYYMYLNIIYILYSVFKKMKDIFYSLPITPPTHKLKKAFSRFQKVD